MHRCRHEEDEDHYASGAETRHHNRDRLKRDVTLHDNLRRIIRGGYGPPFGGLSGMPGHLYGLGPGGYGHGSPFSSNGGPYGHPEFSGLWGPGFYPLPYGDGSDSDYESPSPWYPPAPPPYYGVSPSCTSGRSSRSIFGRPFGRGVRNPRTDAVEHEYYQHVPRSLCSHEGHRY